MASTLTLNGASISMKAMSLGAADYVPKPTSTSEINSAQEFKRELLSKVKAGARSPAASGRPSGQRRSPPLPSVPKAALWGQPGQPPPGRQLQAGMPGGGLLDRRAAGVLVFQMLFGAGQGLEPAGLPPPACHATFTTIRRASRPGQRHDLGRGEDGEPVTPGADLQWRRATST